MLRDIYLKKTYSSVSDNLLKDFYIPVLEESINYKRITGFFSSTSLLLASQGIADFFSGDGNYDLISGVIVEKKDYEAIIKGNGNVEDLIMERAHFNPDVLKDELEKDHLRVLAWLISTKRLKLKIAVLPEDYVGLFHEKIGIFEDKNGDKVSFSGSINESGAGWSRNIEEFKVFRGWVEEEIGYLNRDITKFSDYWDNNITAFSVVDIPQALERQILRIRPESETIVRELVKKIKCMNNSKIELYPYQKEAIESWEINDRSGIFEMATGTGKTLTALSAIKSIYNDRGRYFTVIAVPYTHLITQWLEDIGALFPQSYIVECYGGVSGWRSKLKQAVANYDDGFFKEVIAITTYDTISSSSFINTISSIRNLTYPFMLIADEMHNLGAPTSGKSMVKTFNMRLGLSATPTRWFDEFGTKQLFDYFEKVTFSYTLKQAIGDDKLTHYDYFPLIAVMSGDEFKKYKELTYRILRNFKTNKTELENIYLKILLLRRSKIIKNNADKINQFQNLIEELKLKDEIGHVLVYCDTGEQVSDAQKILNKFGIINHKFTETESLKDRNTILENFDRGVYQCLVAMRCLDEGVNVPSTKTAIILASSSNPREYIQRRGRVLRKYPGKNKAIIYDFIVIPPIDSLDNSLMNVEQKILKKELERSQEFFESADNKTQVLNILSDIMIKFGVYFN